jgi:hypothetical protein
MAPPVPPVGSPLFGQYSYTDSTLPYFDNTNPLALSQWDGSAWVAVEAKDLYAGYSADFNVDMASHGSITNMKPQALGDSLSANQAATVGYAQAYADSVAQGLDIKNSCLVASTVPVTISSPGSSIGGVTLTVVGSRVLLAGQGGDLVTASTANGIYVWNGAAVAMTRATDCAAGSDASGAFTFVESGTAAGSGYVCNTPSATFGTTAITFTLFSSAGSFTAGAGLRLVGNEFNVNVDQGPITNNTIQIDGNNNVAVRYSDGLQQASGGLAVKLVSGASALTVGSSGLAVKPDNSTITIVSDELAVTVGSGLTVGTGIEVAPGAGIALSGGLVVADVDNVSIKSSGGTGAQLAVKLSSAGTSGLDITGGLHAVAGAGISVGSNIAVNLGSNSGLDTSAGLVAVAGNGISVGSSIAVDAGAGLDFSGTALIVKAGAGIETTTNSAVNVKLLPTTSGLDLTGGLHAVAGAGITVGADIAIDLATQSGLNLTSGLAVSPGNGIELTVGDAVAVKLAASDPGLQFVSGGLSVLLATSASALSLSGGLNVLVDNSTVHVTGAGAGTLSAKLDPNGGLTSSLSGIAVNTPAVSAITVGSTGVSVNVDNDTIVINGGNDLAVNYGNGLANSGNKLIANVDNTTIVNNYSTNKLHVNFDSSTLTDNSGSGPLAVNYGNGLSTAGGSLAVLANPTNPSITVAPAGLSVKLDTVSGSGLTVASGNGLAVLADPNSGNPTIAVASAGVSVNLGTASGLTASNGGLEVLANPTNATISVASAGISVKLATTPGLTALSSGLAFLPDPTNATLAVGAGGVSVKKSATGALSAVSDGLAVNVAAPVIISGNNVTVQAASGSQNGYLSSSDYTKLANLAAGTLAGTLTQSSPGTATVTGATVTLPPNSMTTIRVVVALYGGSAVNCAQYIVEGGFYMGTTGSIPTQVGSTVFIVSQRGSSVAAGSLPGFSVASNGVLNVTGTYSGTGQAGTLKWSVNGLYSTAQ